MTEQAPCGCTTPPNTEEAPRIECDLLGCQCTLEPQHDGLHHCTACGREWERLVWDPSDSYDRYLFEMSADGYDVNWPGMKPIHHDALLPHHVDQAHPSNRCERCGAIPVPINPTWKYNGQPADLENDPSRHDLPYTLCERCIKELQQDDGPDWDGPEGATAVYD